MAEKTTHGEAAVAGATLHGAHAVAKEHVGAADHGAHDAHGPALGRTIEHRPEPPHLVQIWYLTQQKSLIEQYEREHPGQPTPSVVEPWLKTDAHGQLVPVEGQRPTVAQLLHVGAERQKLPLVDYMPWENHLYLAVAAILLIFSFVRLTSDFRRDKNQAMRRPSRSQMIIEMIVGGFDQFTKGILGAEHGRRYMPFIGSLFCLILVSNLMGLVPLMKAPTSYVIVTFSLALCTFVTVQATAWFRLGPVSYMHHLMGSPKDILGWCLAPLFIILELISDFFAKPVSLTLRLFGNIMGKDILLGAFMGMGISVAGLLSGGLLSDWVGIPLTVPFVLLGLLLSTIQALVFALLTTIYISLVLPHGDDDHDDHHGEAGHGHGEGKGGLHHSKPVHEPIPHRGI